MKMKISFWIILILIATSLLSSCGPGISISATATPNPMIEAPTSIIKPQLPNSPTETPSVLGQYMIPTYYPDSYITIVNESKAEGNLTIYSNMSDYSWNFVIKTFNSHYPWIRVTTIETGASGAFTQYSSEVAENKPTADMIISSDPVGWSKFIEARKELIYTSEEGPYLPDMAKSVYRTYVVSVEPMVILYNKKSVPVPPKNMTELAVLVNSDLSGYKGQIATIDADLNATGFAANWFWIDEQGSYGWDILNTIGESHPVLMESESKVVEAVGKGEAKIGYFASVSAIISYLKTYPDIGWAYMGGSQPVLLNSMAITENAANPNSAKLMADFILSQEGQYALALGGLTPYRSDISSITEYHLDKIFAESGNNNVHLYSFDTRLNYQTIIDTFLGKWRDAVHKEIVPTPEPTQSK
jgi:iron(III) transport system substrate-binding protein